MNLCPVSNISSEDGSLNRDYVYVNSVVMKTLENRNRIIFWSKIIHVVFLEWICMNKIDEFKLIPLINLSSRLLYLHIVKPVFAIYFLEETVF